MFLKNFLEKCEMTQDQLAKELGVSQSVVSRWLSYDCRIGIDKIDAMAEIFDVSRTVIWQAYQEYFSDLAKKSKKKQKK